ncbi:biotin transporter BioY [Anaerotalea alkaliphila]|uniref:Biotin transporter n=1 Tax=Anaerotalea alkaliphila TaxID=2662126 RepID=A0A7X5HX71_9FIRM|nr:biotin transporter BioY [Anaerotalea alkaliphila]NDL68290.1 biotin transporter BioY [Anaerotalea alkaliphila]
MKLTTKEMILVAMFAALAAVGAFIKVPTPIVPFTLQFLFVSFAGLILGARKGAMAVGLYILIGLTGIPVFANGGGITYVFQPTFGYLLGFVACAFVVGLANPRNKKTSFPRTALSLLGGLAAVYAIGVPYMYMVVNLVMGKSMTVVQALGAGMLPFLATDLAQIIVISLAAVLVLPKLKRAGVLPA